MTQSYSAPPVPQLRQGFKVALLGTRGIPAAYGGFETFAEQLAVRLVQRGHHVTVYAEAERSDLPDTWHQGVRIRHIQRPKWGPASVIGYDCRCLADARCGYDLVYMLGYGAAWACWWARKVWGQKIWINVDGLEWARSKWGMVARAYLRAMEWVSSWAPTRVLADAQAIADRFQRNYPLGVPCSFIAYGASVIEPRCHPATLLARWGLITEGYVLVVARPEPENHLVEIIEGYLQSQLKWPLVIVGDVKPVTKYQCRLLAFSSEQVRFIGGIYDANMLTALRAHAACHVHGHSVGGTNPSLLEALACGNMIIAHDNPFNREVARDAAWFFNGAKQLANHLQVVQSLSANDRALASRRAQSIVSNYYTWILIADAYEALLRAELTASSSVAQP